MEKIAQPLMNESALSGVLDKNLKKLGARLGVGLALRGDQLLIDGHAPTTAFAHFNDKDFVRHPLVQKIIKAYQKAEAKEG